jgi:hypothetical protein
MVLLTDDWGSFKDYSQYCRVGSYQSKTTEEGLEIRVQTGKFAIVVKFDDLDKPEQRSLYDDVKAFCETRGFIKVVGCIDDEMFHA